MDLGWCALLCLAQQKLANGIPSEAFNIFQTIVKYNINIKCIFNSLEIVHIQMDID
jgi:hypothetical protein